MLETRVRNTSTTSGGGSVAIGSAVGSGTANSVLYIGSTGLLAERNPGFTYDGSTLKLRLNGSANIAEFGDGSGTAFSYINPRGQFVSGTGITGAFQIDLYGPGDDPNFSNNLGIRLNSSFAGGSIPFPAVSGWTYGAGSFLSPRGFTMYDGGGVLLASGPSLGIGVAVNRIHPGIGVINAGGPSIRTEQGQVEIWTGTAAGNGLIIKGYTSQSADPFNYIDISTNILTKINATGNISEAIGSTTSLMTEVGVANVQTSSGGIGNAADTTDDTLFTYSLPTNSMSANGKSVRAIATGHFATNGNTKQVKFWFAGTAIADSGALTLSNTDWMCEIEITRIDSTHVSAVGRFTGSNVASIITVTANLAVSDLTANASVIKITGASTLIGAANDIKGYLMKTWFEN